eukprot:GHRR01032076.1.p1 GENE.GHRR01032076.1~~GHRR01032076.1.p1  ORF type:complete len:188 (+),score=71.35 GHRR01032076.1:941-1504(+)
MLSKLVAAAPAPAPAAAPPPPPAAVACHMHGCAPLLHVVTCLLCSAPLQIYNTAKLTLVMIGPQLPHTVNALACKGDLTFAATGAIIHEAKRSYMTGKYASHSGRILQLLVLADQLLSLGRNSKLLVWKIGDYQQPQTIIDFGPDFKPTCMIHPDTYINKVVVGGQDGSLQLWNFVTGQLVHTFKGW